MNSNRRLIAAVFVVALSGLSAPSLADAGSLLSGYGGPGQGSQVIIGSTLLNGGGGSSHGGSGGAGGEATAPGSSAGATLEAASVPSPVARRGQRAAQGHRPGAARTVGTPARTQEKPATALLARNAAEESRVGDPVLGISAADLVYILLALAVLVVTAVLTRAIARPSRGNGPAG